MSEETWTKEELYREFDREELAEFVATLFRFSDRLLCALSKVEGETAAQELYQRAAEAFVMDATTPDLGPQEPLDWEDSDV